MSVGDPLSSNLLVTGDRIELQLESLAAGGEMMAHCHGLAVFVRGGVPGDRCLVEITGRTPHFARGRALKVLEPSPHRAPARCRHSLECGGCQLQELAYPEQLRQKKRLVEDSLSRIGRLQVEVGDPLGMADPWRYRNQAEYAVGPEGIGYFEVGTHRVIPVEDCLLQHPISIAILRAAGDWLQSAWASAGEIRRLETRVSFSSGEALAIISGRPPLERLRPLADEISRRVPELAGVLAAASKGPGGLQRGASHPLLGRDHLRERLGEWEYRVGADSFFQVNPAQAERLLALALETAGLSGRQAVIDCYCGVGTFLIPAALRSRLAAGIEDSPSAARDVRANLRHYRLERCELLEGRAERELPRAADRGWKAEVVLLDPPRRGCAPGVLEALPRLGASRVIVISCHPATLARDLGTLTRLGYRINHVQPVDMFPHTWHIECLALAER